jgi:uncharacterized protein YndB with AHSA1/START domain
MEYGSIEREIHVAAAPDIVYQVVSQPEHLREWWPDEAELDPVPGGTGAISFGPLASPDGHTSPVTVVEADPPRRFSFRWDYDPAEAAAASNSMLVTFDLVPVSGGTLLRLTETGFRERGWEAAVLEERYRDHASGWDYFLPRLAPYVARLASAK